MFSANSFAIGHEKQFFITFDEYLKNYYFLYHPTWATQCGKHEYDDQLEDYSRKNIEKQVLVLKSFEKKFSSFSPSSVNAFVQGDRTLVLNDIHSALLTIQRLRYWQKDPGMYVRSVTESIYVLIERHFSSEENRLRSLIEREKKIPVVLYEARHNLVNPPRIYTDLALQQLSDTIKFFERDVPHAFTHIADPDLQRAFSASQNAVIQALLDYQEWIKNNLVSRSQGDFRIGRENFIKKLAYDEMVDTPLNELLAMNLLNMHANQAEFSAIAQKLYPGKTLEQVLVLIKQDHPPANQLLLEFKHRFEDLRTFIKNKNIIFIPSERDPVMRETPPFLRSITFASMNVPGPFEQVATESYFNVTLPEASWSRARVESFMGEFNYPSINSIAIHEAYPGHYVQFLWVKRIKDPVRRLLGAASNTEGWAHYCEQMMLDEGLHGKTERETALYRLGELLNALLRNARFAVSIQMHAGQMTFDEAVHYFMQEGYLSKEAAIMESKRGTLDPTYLYYTLGKLQILKLREDLLKKEGSAFQLKKFHDDFMQQGYPPIKIVRNALLNDNSPTL
jgi:hypothetical protein